MKKVIKKKPVKKKVVKKAKKIAEPFVPRLQAPTEFWIGPGGFDPSDELKKQGYKKKQFKAQFEVPIPDWIRKRLHGEAEIENPNRKADPFIEDIRKIFADCLALVEKKNADYSGASLDPFKNIRNAGFVGVSVERGVLVRMMDKMGRISSLLDREAQVSSESIDDTLNDLINYAAILKLYIKDSRTLIGSR